MHFESLQASEWGGAYHLPGTSRGGVFSEESLLQTRNMLALLSANLIRRNDVNHKQSLILLKELFRLIALLS